MQNELCVFGFWLIHLVTSFTQLFYQIHVGTSLRWTVSMRVKRKMSHHWAVSCSSSPHTRHALTFSTMDSAKFFFEHLLRFRRLVALQNTTSRDRNSNAANVSRLAPTWVSTRHGPLYTRKIESGDTGNRSAGQHPAGPVFRWHFSWRKYMLAATQFFSPLATASIHFSHRDCALTSK